MAANTGKPGGQLGNKNSSKSNRLWRETIQRALVQDGEEGKKLRAIADKLIEKAAEGEMMAIKELGDRLDGKPAQVIAGDDENPLTANLNIKFVDNE